MTFRGEKDKTFNFDVLEVLFGGGFEEFNSLWRRPFN